MSDTDWIKPGAKVVIDSGYGHSRMMTPATVERLTKLHAVVNGRKFRLRDGCEVGNTSTWRPAPRLLNPSAPKVQQDLAERRAHFIRSRTESSVSALLTGWRRDDDDDAAREALTVLTAALAEIERLTS